MSVFPWCVIWSAVLLCPDARDVLCCVVLSTPTSCPPACLLLLLLLLQREGNVLMSFNNRPATDSIPFLSPFLAPSARAVGPLLEQLATSPFRYASFGMHAIMLAGNGACVSFLNALPPLNAMLMGLRNEDVAADQRRLLAALLRPCYCHMLLSACLTLVRNDVHKTQHTVLLFIAPAACLLPAC